MPKTSRQKALLCAKVALDKLAKEVLILEMKDLTPIFDYFVICSGSSDKHIQTIVDGIVEKLKESNIDKDHIEGKEEWVLIDYDDVVVHIFHPETRKFYELEGLWADAKRIKLGA